MKKIFLIILSFVSIMVFAHAPLLEVEEDEPGYIYIQAGFSNGESAEGLDVIIVKDKNYNGSEETYDGQLVLFKGVFDKNSEIILPKPKAKRYIVIFDGGPGHVKKLSGIALKPEEKAAWQEAINKDKKLGEWKEKYIGNVK